MKTVLGLTILVLVAFVLAGCGGGKPKHESEDALAKYVFEALKKNDVKMFMEVFPGDEDAEYLVGQAMKANPSWRDSDRRGLETKTKKLFNDLRGDLMDIFKGVRERGERDFGWANAEFGNIETRGTGNSNEWNLPNGDIYFTVSAGGKAYRIKLDNCVKFEAGWKPSGKMTYSGAPRERKKRTEKATEQPDPADPQEEADEEDHAETAK